MRKRAGALCIKNNKLLLISEDGKEKFWTPGGGLEEGESFIQALRRELIEELSTKLLSHKSFLKYLDEAKDEYVEYFLVDIEKPGNLQTNTRIHWFSTQDFESDEYKISKRILNIVYPELLQQGLMKKA